MYGSIAFDVPNIFGDLVLLVFFSRVAIISYQYCPMFDQCRNRINAYIVASL